MMHPGHEMTDKEGSILQSSYLSEMAPIDRPQTANVLSKIRKFIREEISCHNKES